MAPERAPFSYAVVRIVPQVERGEAINAGVVLFARTRGFLQARIALDPAKLAALDPTADHAALARQLDGLAHVAAGDPAGGPIARLDASERFHWLTAPASTIVQSSPVHTGLTADPAAELDHLFERLVRR